MNRVGFSFQVRRDKLTEYQKLHRKVWPEMLDALRRCGWKNYSLFMRNDGLVFGCFETEADLHSARSRIALEPVYARWQLLMADYTEPPGDSNPGVHVTELQEVFHLD